MSLSAREVQLLDALETLAEQADEDMPVEYRTRHFESALQDAYDLINHIFSQEGE